MADKENKAAENSEVPQAETEESKAAAKVAKAAKGGKKENRPGALSRAGQNLKRYFKDVRGETKKIVWPDAKTVLKSTGVVLLVVVVVSIIIYGIDQGLSAGITGLKKLATNDTSVSETVDEETTDESGEVVTDEAEGEDAEEAEDKEETEDKEDAEEAEDTEKTAEAETEQATEEKTEEATEAETEEAAEAKADTTAAE